ncbi:hypothetical protein STEG23_018956, partial [Scotinomys teguina]
MAMPGEPCTGLRVWNQTEEEPVAHHLLSLCFLRTAGGWAPPMYLWVLGPIYLFYIHRHGRCYLRMSHLFKGKMVLGFALILLYTFNVAMPLWRIHQGMPQAPESLIHPTVWLTTMRLSCDVCGECGGFPVVCVGSVEAFLWCGECGGLPVVWRGVWRLSCGSFATFLIIWRKKESASRCYLDTGCLLSLLPAINFAQQASAGNPRHETEASFPSKAMFCGFWTLFEQQYMYRVKVLQMRLRTAITGLVYRKVLVLSSGSRKSSAAGDVVNLVSVDIQRLTESILYLSSWLLFLWIIVCFVYLWQLLGPSALTAIAVFLSLLPLNFFITKKRSYHQEEQMRQKASRARLTSSVLRTVRTIKSHGWEQAFLERLLHIRGQELGALKTSTLLFSVSLVSFQVSTFLVALVVFAVHTLVAEDNAMDAEKAFVTLTVLSILNKAQTFLPFSVHCIIQARVSFDRLAAFLCLEEVDPKGMDSSPSRCSSKDRISVHNGTFAWSQESPPCLHGINLTVPQGCLLAVVGPVGAGKSSLLSALLGELLKVEGSVNIE